MARRKIREYDAKKLLGEKIEGYDFKGVYIGPNTKLETLEKENPWLKSEKLVVKPDQLIGKKGKHKIILVNATWEDAKKFLKEHIGKEIEIKGIKGKLNRFFIEPFVEHDKEYYLAILTKRDYDEILFSSKGGVDIEENWDSVKSLKIPVGKKLENKELKELLKGENKKLAEFTKEVYKFFVEQDCSYIESNPLAFDKNNTPIPLGLVLELDRCADFKHMNDWEFKFPESFGKAYTKEEQFVRDLDAQTGSSLKLTMLNPKGKVWLLVAGGGASVVYSDTVADLGIGPELANYGEYSGNPSKNDTYYYAKTILDLMTRDEVSGKVLLIGGGIANFTNVATTFTGIIQALEEYAEKLRKLKVRIYVRRGGPNYEQGLEWMKKTGERLNLPIDVYGPETQMTKIVALAKEVLK